MSKRTDPLEEEVKAAIKEAVTELWPTHWHLMVVPHGYGGVGTFDHIIAAPIKITPEMVGKTYGMFVGIEAKRRDEPLSKWKKMQRLNAAEIVRVGGFAAVVFGSEQIPQLIKNIKRYFHIT